MNLDIAINEEEEAEAEAEEGSNNDITTTFGRDCGRRLHERGPPPTAPAGDRGERTWSWSWTWTSR